MGEWLVRYGPPILAWSLFAVRRGGQDRGRRSVRWVFGGLAVSLTALTPAGHAVIKELTGAVDLPRLVGHAGVLFAAWAAQRCLAHLNGTPAGFRRQSWWIAGMFVVMCVFFALTPNLMPQSPWVMEYCFAYAAAQIPAFAGVIVLCLRYARIAGDPALRTGLWLVVAGTAAAMLYLVNKTILAASPRWDFDYPLGREFLVGKILPMVAHVLVLSGVALPAVAGWLSRYRLYRRLSPLWTDLYRADPEIALDPPGAVALGNLKLRLYRRVIEIRDGLLALHPYRDPMVAVAARRGAQRAGLAGRSLEAEVEAAVVAEALLARARGAAPREPAAVVSGGGDLASDTTYLRDVADAYRRKIGDRNG
ncbi:hypothetical protein DMA12_28215 [Amycolatopsis balhimycina DSM 5908]|uniref:DUF6545 domain-containing protein n=1 Tax=Amycolatopsis balhimycina DSM 5908 TaxID=1081091 RepID=A0A428WAN8_AMYBA|nr:MAB_1171c family putative transporter [Amycolatopsis balhimycina]RSM40007.1 hypothetical protein DMA12_28215 [Amycolatopsis balhimycina DSM 5908]